MSALRDERGLRAAERNAEPQVVGLAPQTTVMTERANTMKTYVLRDPNPVEPQNCKPPPRPQRQPAAPAAPKPAPGPTLFIGLDVHNDSIAVSLAPSDSPEVRRYGIIGGQHDDVLKLLKKLAAAHPGAALQCCYEAGPRGYPLCRCLRQHGAECIIVSPSKVPRLPGDRVKTDRRDADQLARLFRAGELTGIYVPDAGDEAIRDLVRGRESARVDQLKARQRLKGFLLRHGFRYAGKSSWTEKHQRYLASLVMPFAAQQIVLREYIEAITVAASGGHGWPRRRDLPLARA